MSQPKRPRRLFRLPFGPGRERSEAEDEVRFHIQEVTHRLMREGMTEEEARREARRRFGNVDAVVDEVEELMTKRKRTMRKTDRVDGLRRDVAFSLRQLGRNPGFALIAIFTIALAIGATTSVFSVVDGIMLRALPYDEPDELVMIWADYTRRDVVLPDKSREWLSWDNFMDLRDQVPAIEAAAAFGGFNPTMTGTGSGAQRVSGAAVSRGMLVDVLGEEPALGRSFTVEEARADGPNVVVISDGFWRRAFGADPTIVDQTVLLGNQPFTIVGVMPAAFRPLPFLGTDLWTPLQLDETSLGRRGGAWLRAVGRLTDAGAFELARTQADELGARLEEEYPVANNDIGYNLYPLQSDLVRNESSALWVLLAAVVFVLLIGCVNVANLLVARGTTRTAELAVRVALGAGRGRVVSQLVTESLLLAVIGGTIGIALAFVGTDALIGMAPAGTPRLDQVGVDGRILLFAAAVTMSTGALFGILPALRAARTDPAGALRAGGRSGGSHNAARLRNSLVVGQIGMALVLLVGAGLLVRSFQNLSRVDLGFEPEGVVALQVQLPQVRYPDAASRLGFFNPLEERLASLPGVQSAGSITNLPLMGFDGDNTFWVEGAPAPEPGLEPSVWLRRITPGYFETMGLPLLKGRGFDSSDDGDAARVIIVNETLERDYFDGNAIGKRLNVNDPDNPVWREVVGVARDVKNFGVRAESRNALYVPYTQAATTFMFTVVKTSMEPAAIIGAVRSEVAALDTDIALANVQPMTEIVATSMQTDRFTTTLLGGFALVALLLAVVGLYGVVSYSVSTRIREMGVRIALGANGGGIRSLVLRWSLGLAAVGIVLGSIGAFGLTRLLDDLLFEVSATDVTTFGAVSVVMALAALVASLVPAMRATRVDPVSVLKSD
ncbi:MAG: ABC transporter permease [Gemmatimonadota bacterium]